MTLSGLTKQSPAHREEYIVHLSKKPIRTLWEKQAAIKAHQKFIFNEYLRALRSNRFKEAEKLEHISAELEEQEKTLKAAIKRK